MARGIRDKLKSFFETPKIGDVTPTYLRESRIGMSTRSTLFPSEDAVHHARIESIEIANMALQKKALSHSLKIQHRTMIITLLAVVIAFMSSALALIIALNQTPPKVMIELKDNEQKTIQETN